MEAKIFINGVIGPPDYMESETSLLDVITQVQNARASLGESLTFYKILIDSPGGVVSEGDNIYNFLVDLSKETEIIMQSNGRVESIASKIFFASNMRIIRAQDKLMIHTPWVHTAGDSQSLKRDAQSLEKIEKEMITFYSVNTSVSKEGIAALMQNETFIDAKTAVELGFATGLAEPIKALALNDKSKPITMRTFKELKAFMLEVTKKEDNPIVNLSTTLEDGTEVFINAETLEDAVGVAMEMVGEEGNTPAAEGNYTLSDGTVVSVDAEGLITAVEAGAPEETEEMKALREELEALKAKQEETLAANVELIDKLTKFTSPEFDEAMKDLSTKLEDAEKAEAVAMAMKSELVEIKTEFKIPLNQTFKKSDATKKTDDDRIEEAKKKRDGYKQRKGI